MNINCKIEFTAFVTGVACPVLAAELRYDGRGYFTAPKHVVLPVGYTEVEYERFLNAIDFMYDAGYGRAYFSGSHIWFTDGTWADRVEYDGSEWWEHRKMPPLPEKSE